MSISHFFTQSNEKKKRQKENHIKFLSKSILANF